MCTVTKKTLRPGLRQQAIVDALPRKTSNPAGYTIIEVLLAVIVLAFVISTSITTLHVGYRSIDTARNTTIASQVLQSMVEDIRLLSWSGTGGPAGINISNLTNVTNGTLSQLDFDQTNHYQSNSITDYSPAAAAMLTRFRFDRSVSNVSGRVDGAGVPNMKMITLTARWTGIDGQSHTLKYTTYYAKDGLYAYYST